jgi:putative spermidine/putrescine transport system ATP-binding protein
VAYLRLRNVIKSYDGKTNAVDNITVDIDRGEFVTFLGPSGSGKTTTLLLIAGFEYPTGGMIELGGADLSLSRPYERNIGMVFQNYALFPHMTAVKNVMFPLRMRRFPRRERHARAQKMLDLVGAPICRSLSARIVRRPTATGRVGARTGIQPGRAAAR